MHTFILIIDNHGAPAHYTHSNDSWCSTDQVGSFLKVEAASAKSACNKFVKLLGIEVRYRDGDNGVTDRNLHSFHVRLLSDYLAEIN